MKLTLFLTVLGFTLCVSAPIEENNETPVEVLKPADSAPMVEIPKPIVTVIDQTRTEGEQKEEMKKDETVKEEVTVAMKNIEESVQKINTEPEMKRPELPAPVITVVETVRVEKGEPETVQEVAKVQEMKSEDTPKETITEKAKEEVIVEKVEEKVVVPTKSIEPVVPVTNVDPIVVPSPTAQSVDDQLLKKTEEPNLETKKPEVEVVQVQQPVVTKEETKPVQTLKPEEQTRTEEETKVPEKEEPKTTIAPIAQKPAVVVEEQKVAEKPHACDQRDEEENKVALDDEDDEDDDTKSIDETKDEKPALRQSDSSTSAPTRTTRSRRTRTTRSSTVRNTRSTRTRARRTRSTAAVTEATTAAARDDIEEDEQSQEN